MRFARAGLKFQSAGAPAGKILDVSMKLGADVQRQSNILAKRSAGRLHRPSQPDLEKRLSLVAAVDGFGEIAGAGKQAAKLMLP